MKYRANSQDTWHKIKVKALDGMPVGSIVDYDGQASDIPSGWEQQGNDYSTTETDTGQTWTDGKKIYRKVLTGTLSSSGSNNAGDVEDIGDVVNISGTIKGTIGGNSYEYKIGDYISSSYYVGVQSQYMTSPDAVRFTIWIPNTFTSFNYKLIVEYTKTTD